MTGCNQSSLLHYVFWQQAQPRDCNATDADQVRLGGILICRSPTIDCGAVRALLRDPDLTFSRLTCRFADLSDSCSTTSILGRTGNNGVLAGRADHDPKSSASTGHPRADRYMEYGEFHLTGCATDTHRPRQDLGGAIHADPLSSVVSAPSLFQRQGLDLPENSTAQPDPRSSHWHAGSRTCVCTSRLQSD